MTREVVLRRLADGWDLEPHGSRTLSGLLCHGRIKGYRVSEVVMNSLVLDGLIRLNYDSGLYVLTDAGRKVVRE